MKRIAHVEDNPDNRLLVQALVADTYELIEYENGADALAGLASVRPDLVLLDISLPGIEGPEVLRRLRADPATASFVVVALTAHAMDGDRERLLSIGFDEYISKPIVDHDEFLRTLERLIVSP